MPDWKELKRVDKENGYEIKVHGYKESTLENVTASLKNSAVTVIATHGNQPPGTDTTNAIMLGDGNYLADDGVRAVHGTYLELPHADKPEANGELLVLLGCDTESLAAVVQPTHPDYQLVDSYSGKDRETELQGVLNATHDFVEGYVEGGLKEGLSAGNQALRNTVRQWPMNRGDKLIPHKIEKDGITADGKAH